MNIIIEDVESKDQPKYVENVIRSLMENGSKKVVLLTTLPSNIDVGELVNLLDKDKDSKLLEKAGGEHLTNLIKTIKELKQEYTKKLEVVPIGGKAYEVVESIIKGVTGFQNSSSEKISKLAQEILNDEGNKKFFNITEEEFDRMTTEEKIKILGNAKEIADKINKEALEVIKEDPREILTLGIEGIGSYFSLIGKEILTQSKIMEYYVHYFDRNYRRCLVLYASAITVFGTLNIIKDNVGEDLESLIRKEILLGPFRGKSKGYTEHYFEIQVYIPRENTELIKIIDTTYDFISGFDSFDTGNRISRLIRDKRE